MKPIEIGCIIWVRGVEPEAAVAMPGKDVLDDRGRFSKQQVAVLDDWCGAERMQGFELGRRETRDRVAAVVPQFIRNAEFFAKPDDTLGLRVAEVMDRENECLAGRCPLSKQRRIVPGTKAWRILFQHQ